VGREGGIETGGRTAGIFEPHGHQPAGFGALQAFDRVEALELADRNVGDQNPFASRGDLAAVSIEPLGDRVGGPRLDTSFKVTASEAAGSIAAASSMAKRRRSSSNRSSATDLCRGPPRGPWTSIR
jgi:hypothetical protein